MASITLPNTFSANTTILSAEVNSNFTTIYNDYNTNITNVNVSATAGIARSKLAETPSCSAVIAAATSITDSLFTTVGMTDTDEWDNDNMHDTATNPSRITIRTAGRYIIQGYGQWAASATGARFFDIRKNAGTQGALRIQSTVQNLPASTIFQNITGLVDCAVNDYLELYIYQNSGGALNFSTVAVKAAKI